MHTSSSTRRFPLRSRAVSSALAVAAVLVLTSPAAARDGREGRDSATGDIAERLSDPSVQLAASAALAAMVESVLDMDIAPIARAARTMGGGGAMGDLPPDARVRDLAGPDARNIPGDVARKVPRAMGSAAEMAGAVDDMMPQLRETARRMKDALPGY